MRQNTDPSFLRAQRRGNPFARLCVVVSLALVPVASLSACWTPTGTQAPVEVVRYGAKSGAGSTGMHTVLGGDTVYTVSKKYNLPLREIISINHLSPPYTLNTGFRLKLPPPNEYTVRPGDTLNGISRLFSVSVSEMARTNNIPSPYVLRTGQVIRLPAPQPKLAEEMAANQPVPSFEQVSLPVKVGAIEREALSPLPSSGQASAAPAAGQVAGSTAGAGSATPVSATAAKASGVKTPPQPTAKAPDAQAAPAKVQQAAVVPPSVAPKVPARSLGNGKFMRPVDGKVISRYGPKEGGLHNDGINIRAARGTAVRAADNGVVAYVGSEMQGYGTLVLIRHADRWMTAYAHMDKALVKKGETVKAGQSIGTVGATGGVDSPQLHFEVRKGTQAMNPELYL